MKEFLSKNPTTRHAYNMRNESAASTALKAEQFGIYEFLISHGVCLGPHEDLSEILGQQQLIDCHDGRRVMMKKIVLHEMHKKYFKQPFANHLMALLSHSHVGFETAQVEHRGLFKHIKEAYELLDQVEIITPILKLVSKSKFFRIIFDFNRDSVSYVDPLTCKNTKGTSYFKSGYIYIGAKGLLEELSKFEVLGTLAHELTHYAMQLVYENYCKPYRGYDLEAFRVFDNIAMVCEFQKTFELKILSVFNYPRPQQHAELIVRVPHLSALYMNDQEKLENLRKAFSELFNYFTFKALVDVVNEEPLMLAKRETVELNDWLGVLQPLIEKNLNLKPENLNIDLKVDAGISLVISNCVMLTVKAIYLQLQRDMETKVENVFVFARPKAFESEKLKAVMVKAMNLPTKPIFVFQCDDDVLMEELTPVIEALKTNERIIFVVKDEGDGRFEHAGNFKLVKVIHAWEDFPAESQAELWKYKVNFQGREMALGNVMTIPSKAVESIPYCDLLGHRLKISEALDFKEIDFFIERKFVKQSQGIRVAEVSCLHLPTSLPYK